MTASPLDHRPRVPEARRCPTRARRANVDACVPLPMRFAPYHNGELLMDFLRKLELASVARESVLCVCLNPAASRIPEILGRGPQAVLRFNRRIIKATSDYAAAFKLNLAFYEQLGAAAMDVLTLTLQAIPTDIPVIADAKRGDVPNTAEAY